MRNLQVAVKEAGDHIIFLRKVEPGKADRSYGIEVARLAGLPHARDRARARSAASCTNGRSIVRWKNSRRERRRRPVQIQLFEPVDEIADASAR